MSPFEDELEAYDYAFPKELIAKTPASPRDSARLLVFDRRTGGKIDAIFRDIGKYLPEDALLVLNETRVIPARLPVRRISGSSVELLYLGTEGDHVRFLSPKNLREGETLSVDDVSFRVLTKTKGSWILDPSFPISDLALILEKKGLTPLPPYIEDSPLAEIDRRREYQSVFAREKGSIAAPTASLHFTKELLESLKLQGINIIPVTLHVHLGTFAPLTEDQWKTGKLHEEYFSIPKESKKKLEEAKASSKPILAVGTTAVRVLETAFGDDGKIHQDHGTTDLFIREGYSFKAIDGMITNFHVPRSSLLMLVSALTGRKEVLNLYAHAMRQKYRLFSFGDAMLLL